MFENRPDLLQVLDSVLQVAAQRLRGFFIFLALEEIEDLEVFLTLLAVALPVDHGTIREEATNTVDSSDRLQEKGIAGGANDRLVKPHTTLVKHVGAIGLDGPGKKPALSGTAARRGLGIEMVSRLHQCRRFEGETDAVCLFKALRRAEHGRKRPAVARAALGPPLLRNSVQHGDKLRFRDTVEFPEVGFRHRVGQAAMEVIVGDF